jgi:hypothetical protein
MTAGHCWHPQRFNRLTGKLLDSSEFVSPDALQHFSWSKTESREGTYGPIPLRYSGFHVSITFDTT